MVSIVSITKGGDIETRVEKALSLLDVRSNLKLLSDSKILVKPNLARVPVGSPYTKMKGAYELTTLSNKTGEGDITHPEVIRAVLKELRDLGFEEITLGEAAGGAFTDLVYKASKIYDIAREFDIKVVDLNWEDAAKISVPDRTTLDYAWIPKSVFEADLVVSIPAWKCWGDHVTLSLKNIGIGVLPGKYYGWNRAGRYVLGLDAPIHNPVLRARLGLKHGQSIALAGEIVDVCSIVPIGLTVIDGTTIVDGNGVAHGADTIFAGFDPVATDAVATAAIGVDPHKIVSIELAAERGLGTNKLSKIETRGEPLANVRMNVVPPKGNKALLLE